MRVDQDQDRKTMPEPGDDRLLPLPVAPRRLDTAAKEEDQEALILQAAELGHSGPGGQTRYSARVARLAVGGLLETLYGME